MLQWCGCSSGVGAPVVWVLQWCGCSSGVGAPVVWVLQWCGCSSGVGAPVVWVLQLHLVRRKRCVSDNVSDPSMSELNQFSLYSVKTHINF